VVLGEALLAVRAQPLLAGLVQQGKVLRVVLETLVVAVMGLAEAAAALLRLEEME
jgi:hypothetical protein